MSKTISIPVRLAEEKGGMQPLHPLRDPIQYPEQCVYCDGPKSREVTFNINKAVKEAGTTYFYKVTAPYCEKHAKQSKRFGCLLRSTLAISFIIALPVIIPLAAQTVPLIVAITGQGWMGVVGGVATGVIGAMVVAVLTTNALKFILGLILPTIKDYDMGYALGLTVVVAEPKEEAELQAYTLDFTFTNEQFAVAFGEINQLGPEEIAVARDQLVPLPTSPRIRAEARAEARMARLIKTLQDGRFFTERNKAAKALGKIGDTRAVEPLTEALRDKELIVRIEAAKALGRIGDTRAVEPLTEALKDVPGAAAEALGEIGDARAIDALVQALKHKYGKVRRTAAEALGKIGDARALEPLTKVLEDRNKGVRKAVEEALKKIEAKTT